MPPKFYNLADQKLFENYQYIPQEKYRLGLNLPTDATEDEVVTDEGIVNTNAFANAGGGDGPDSNAIINPNYDPYPYRNASEMSFVGATDKIFNPKRLGGAQMPDELGVSTNTIPLGNNRISSSQLGINLPGGQVQNAYTRARNAMNIRGDDTMSRDYPGFTAAEVARLTNNSIQDYRQNYGAQGQYQSDNYYDTVDSPLAYSTDTAAQKMMDNYPGYYEGDDEELTGIRSLISKGVNLIPGMGMARTAANVLGGLMPVNQTSILKNELAGFGIGVNDQGRIVGDRNTLEGIMAGKNFSRLDENSLDKQIDTLRNTLGGKYEISEEDINKIQSGEITDEQLKEKYGITTDLSNRLRLSELGKTQLKEIIKRKNLVYDYRKKQKEKKKKDTTTTTGNNQDGSTTTNNNTTNNTGTVSTTSPDYTPIGPNQPDPGPSINEQIDQNNPNNNNNGGGGGGGASDIADEDRGGYATDDTAGFFAKGGRVKYFYGGKV